MNIILSSLLLSSILRVVSSLPIPIPNPEVITRYHTLDSETSTQTNYHTITTVIPVVEILISNGVTYTNTLTTIATATADDQTFPSTFTSIIDDSKNAASTTSFQLIRTVPFDPFADATTATSPSTSESVENTAAPTTSSTNEIATAAPTTEQVTISSTTSDTSSPSYTDQVSSTTAQTTEASTEESTSTSTEKPDATTTDIVEEATSTSLKSSLEAELTTSSSLSAANQLTTTSTNISSTSSSSTSASPATSVESTATTSSITSSSESTNSSTSTVTASTPSTESKTTTSSTTSSESTKSSTSTSTDSTTSSSGAISTIIPSSIAYSPYTDNGSCKDYDTVQTDLKLISSKKIGEVRIYGNDCNYLTTVLPICNDLGIKVNQGFWISSSGVDSIDDAVSDLISAVNSDSTDYSWDLFSYFTIGNEAIISGYCTPSELISKISSVKSLLNNAGFSGKITTSEPPVMFANYPELCTDSEIDFVGVNIHSYFDVYSSADTAGSFLQGQIEITQGNCPNMDVLVTETGYPSVGNQNGLNIPSVENQKIALKSILDTIGADVTILSTYNDYWKDPGSYGIEQSFGSIHLFA